MGQYTIVIHGTGSHHNFKKAAENKLVPDGEAIMSALLPMRTTWPLLLFVN